ncbi:Metalloenzyme, LuxS/M16 peptidase-like protein, partial [Baffinella frigidus]
MRRTKQQLGYIVAASNKEQDGVRSLVFTVQSAVAEAASIVDKVFTFVDGFASTAIADLPQEAFEASVRGLIAKKLQTDKTLGDEAGRHWGEISAGQYKYDRQAQEVAVLRSLTRKHVQDVFARVVQ